MVLGGCVFNIFESKKIRGTVLADTFEVGDYWGGSDYNTRGAVLGVSVVSRHNISHRFLIKDVREDDAVG